MSCSRPGFGSHTAACRAGTGLPEGAHVGDTHVGGTGRRHHELVRRLELGTHVRGIPKFAAVNSVNSTARISPRVSRNRCASVSTSADGGSSETKYCASFRLMWRAVAGCEASTSSAHSPSACPRLPTCSAKQCLVTVVVAARVKPECLARRASSLRGRTSSR